MDCSKLISNAIAIASSLPPSGSRRDVIDYLRFIHEYNNEIRGTLIIEEENEASKLRWSNVGEELMERRTIWEDYVRYEEEVGGDLTIPDKRKIVHFYLPPCEQKDDSEEEEGEVNDGDSDESVIFTEEKTASLFPNQCLPKTRGFHACCLRDPAWPPKKTYIFVHAIEVAGGKEVLNMGLFTTFAKFYRYLDSYYTTNKLNLPALDDFLERNKCLEVAAVLLEYHIHVRL